MVNTIVRVAEWLARLLSPPTGRHRASTRKPTNLNRPRRNPQQKPHNKARHTQPLPEDPFALIRPYVLSCPNLNGAEVGA